MLDVGRLVLVLRRLAAAGHAVVVIEHHQEVILGADWIIDLGPDGGDGGGELIYQGAPRGLSRNRRRSRTGKALWQRLQRSS
jgi:excinuclease ABC subunit A